MDKLESSSPKTALCQVWLNKISQVALEKIFLKILLMYFCYIVIISPWKIIYLPIDTTTMLRHLMSPLRIFKQATIPADTR